MLLTQVPLGGLQAFRLAHVGVVDRLSNLIGCVHSRLKLGLFGWEVPLGYQVEVFLQLFIYITHLFLLISELLVFIPIIIQLSGVDKFLSWAFFRP